MVGVVSGKIIMFDDVGWSLEGFYWKIEILVKKLELGFDFLIGVSGVIYVLCCENFVFFLIL